MSIATRHPWLFADRLPCEVLARELLDRAGTLRLQAITEFRSSFAELRRGSPDLEEGEAEIQLTLRAQADELEQQAETACPGFLAWIRDPVLRPPPWGTGPIPQGWPGAAVVR